MPGYDRSRIVGVSKEDLEEFICGICLEVFIKPTVTQCCGQTFCFDCINEWLQQNNTCPNDRKSLTRDQLQSPAKMVSNLLSNMKIKCDFQEKGCNVVIKIDDLETHKENECDFNPLRKCNNCCHSILNHLDKDCIKNLVQKLNHIQKEHDLFREKKDKIQIETEYYLNEVLVEHERLKEEYDQFRAKQETDKGEAFIKYRILEKQLSMTERLNDSIKKTNTELQYKISKLEQDNKNILGRKNIKKEKTKLQNKITKLEQKMSDFTGKFKLTKSYNFDEFLKELGVSFALRRLARSSTPIVEITKDGDTYTLKTITAIQNLETKFKLGMEFIETQNDGQNTRTTIIAEGNKLVQTSDYGLKKVKTVREFNGNELKTTSYVGNMISVRVYNRI